MRGATEEAITESAIETFQSTRPMRGATQVLPPPCQTRLFQSTRPMWGATQQMSLSHLPYSFQSTRPMRGATPSASFGDIFEVVSIHAPHAGRDDVYKINLRKDHRFNPRAPCGARLSLSRKCLIDHGFNPRAPCGARRVRTSYLWAVGSFNPRAPCGARQCVLEAGRWRILFQSTRPMRGATFSFK